MLQKQKELADKGELPEGQEAPVEDKKLRFLLFIISRCRIVFCDRRPVFQVIDMELVEFRRCRSILH